MKFIKLFALASVLTLGAHMHAATQQELNDKLFFATSVEKVQTLIDQGADVNGIISKDKSGQSIYDILTGSTPLIHHAHFGNAAIVALLIQHGADVNARTEQGATALLRALQGLFADTCGNTEKVIQTLLENGASLKNCGLDASEYDSILNTECELCCDRMSDVIDSTECRFERVRSMLIKHSDLTTR